MQPVPVPKGLISRISALPTCSATCTSKKLKTKVEAINDRDKAIMSAKSVAARDTDAAPTPDAATKAAKEQANVSVIRDNRTLFMWGLNVGLAALCCGL